MQGKTRQVSLNLEINHFAIIQAKSHFPFSFVLTLNVSRCFQFFISLVCCLTLNNSALRAQDDKKINNQYWLDFIPHLTLSDAFELYGDASLRISNEGKQKIYVLRPSLKLQASPIVSLHAGLGFFYNELTDFKDLLEVRPWEGLKIGWPRIKGINVKHYFRLEQRYFIYQENKKDLFLHRMRYQLKCKVPLNKNTVGEKTLYLPLAFEWLGTSDEELQTVWMSQNRMTAGIAYVFNKFWGLEFEYMYWWSRNLPSKSMEPSDQVFRLRLLRNGWILGE
ncbi:MAG TPA: hypothetical protein DCX54_12655 [Flavobacteriales bacterium]|nr:hypothetical protein [Flavobacteriales bacterium]